MHPPGSSMTRDMARIERLQLQKRRSFHEWSRVFQRRRANIGCAARSIPRRAINWTSGRRCKKLDKRRPRNPRGGCVPHERAETPRRINFACSPSRRQRDRSSTTPRTYGVSVYFNDSKNGDIFQINRIGCMSISQMKLRSHGQVKPRRNSRL